MQNSHILQDFNEAITQFQQFGFSHIEDLVGFCREKWGITAEDFGPVQETNIPS